MDINTHDDCKYLIAWYYNNINDVNTKVELDNSTLLKVIKKGDSSNTHNELWSKKEKFSF